VRTVRALRESVDFPFLEQELVVQLNNGYLAKVIAIEHNQSADLMNF